MMMMVPRRRQRRLQRGRSVIPLSLFDIATVVVLTMIKWGATNTTNGFSAAPPPPSPRNIRLHLPDRRRHPASAAPPAPHPLSPPADPGRLPPRNLLPLLVGGAAASVAFLSASVAGAVDLPHVDAGILDAAGLRIPHPLLDVDPRYFLSGGLCAAASHGVATPIDVVKTRMQSEPEAYDGGFLDAARKILEADGAGVLLTGLGPTVVSRNTIIDHLSKQNNMMYFIVHCVSKCQTKIHCGIFSSSML